MTFLDRKTSREAQKTRQQKDARGRRLKYDTPDRPGTALAYSHTSKAEGKPETAVQRAYRIAQETKRTEAAAAMRRMAGK